MAWEKLVKVKRTAAIMRRKVVKCMVIDIRYGVGRRELGRLSALALVSQDTERESEEPRDARRYSRTVPNDKVLRDHAAYLIRTTRRQINKWCKQISDQCHHKVSRTDIVSNSGDCLGLLPPKAT